MSLLKLTLPYVLTDGSGFDCTTPIAGLHVFVQGETCLQDHVPIRLRHEPLGVHSPVTVTTTTGGVPLGLPTYCM